MRVKNTTGSSIVRVGQTIAAGEYYTIPTIDLPRWQADEQVLLDLASGTLLGNDGSFDLTSANAIKYLLGQTVEIIKQTEPQPFSLPTYRTKLDATEDIISIPAGGDADIQFQIMEERYVTGGTLLVKNAELGDYISATVEDTDALIPEAYRAATCEAWPIVSTYVVKHWFEVEGVYSNEKINTYPLNAKIPAGFYLCIHYYAINSGGTREVAINYNLTKKL